jgi:hypothetical protein
MVWVRERTIPTERPPLVGEVIANFCGYKVPRGQLGSLRPYSRFYRQEPLFFYQVAPQLFSRGWMDPVCVANLNENWSVMWVYPNSCVLFNRSQLHNKNNDASQTLMENDPWFTYPRWIKLRFWRQRTKYCVYLITLVILEGTNVREKYWYSFVNDWVWGYARKNVNMVEKGVRTLLAADSSGNEVYTETT